MSRSNLTIFTGAHATRILFEGTRATGVEFVQEGQTHRAQASREVILSGGTINTPHLLMLSGVGPEERLRELGIPVVADLPGVGQNLQDHLLLALCYVCTQPVSMADVGGMLKKCVNGKGGVTYL
jgi:choline dehydrogenase